MQPNCREGLVDCAAGACGGAGRDAPLWPQVNFKRQIIGMQLIGLWQYVFGKFSPRRESAALSDYLAFSISPEVLAIAVHELDAQDDDEALKKAIPLFHDELKRVEVWCGSRKVGDIPPKSDEKSDGEPIRNSA
jgi:hypothetical protein